MNKREAIQRRDRVKSRYWHFNAREMQPEPDGPWLVAVWRFGNETRLETVEEFEQWWDEAMRLFDGEDEKSKTAWTAFFYKGTDGEPQGDK